MSEKSNKIVIRIPENFQSEVKKFNFENFDTSGFYMKSRTFQVKKTNNLINRIPEISCLQGQNSELRKNDIAVIYMKN